MDETVTTEATEATETETGTDSKRRIPVSKSTLTGAGAVLIGVGYLLIGNAYFERGIELLRDADRR